MTASLRSEKRAPQVDNDNVTDKKRYNLLLAAVLGIAGGALAFWCYFDHSVPSWDAAGHLLNGLSFRELFRHPKPFDVHWYHQLLTVNCFYPPLTYVLAGVIKAVLGTGLWLDSLMKVFYLTVMSISVYGLVGKLTKDRLAAVFSVLVVNLYPEVCAESHKSMLDFPVMSMSALALLTLAWWHDKPSWKRAATLAFATGCGLLTKQVCAAFLVLPFAFYFFGALKRKRFNEAGMLASAGITAGAMLLPWFILATPTIKKVAAEIQVALGNKQVSDVFFSNIGAYVGFIPAMATPLLVVVAVIALLAARKEVHSQMALLWCSLLSATVLLSTLTWQYALPRYYISALIVLAAYSGVLLAQLWRSKSAWKRLLMAGIVSGGILGYVAVNFCPYPLGSDALKNVRTMSLRPVSGVTGDRFEHPYPDEDWGIGWVLNKVKETDGEAPVWLNVLPSTQQLNVHAFEYYGRQGKYQVRPTTSRSWSAAGDSAQFKEEDALHYQWYLLKTGEQGFKFHDPASRANFDRWTDYIAKGGKFEFKGEKQLPDGSRMSLYRQF